ncbi:MAG: DUF6090 family protein [Parvicellaceae bacterium]
MINLFRKIRKKLLSDNKIGNYLIYAFGEIFLVVIGILIALQINNWSEVKKREKLEMSLLKEMKTNLMADIADMQINIGYAERGIKSANIILHSFEKNIPYNDSLNKHYGKVPMVPRFLISENAYNSINNEGIRIIKNDSLRNAITHHYEISFGFIKEWNDSEWNTQVQDHRTIYRQYFKQFDFWGDLIPANYYELIENLEYINYLNNRIGWLNPTIGLYEDRIEGSQNLIKFIDYELEKREN